jgi:CheY-like chemotaxis protein
MTATAPRILVVDDNASLRENLVEALEAEGYSVSQAADGEGAIAALAEDPPPEVVLLDLLMPGLTGREIVDRIRGDPRLARVRVVLTTGHPSPSIRAGVAADTFLPKPFGVKELLEALAQVGA